MFITVINIYSMILGGFVSLSKYGVLSSIRVVAQLFSFDIIQNLLMCLVFVIFGNYIFESYYDTHYLSKSLLPIEYVFITLLAFLAMLMENFRAPFDLAEAEAEVITGYTVEYYGFLFFAFLFSEFLSL
jgi:NADH-quinone oxidoreductase subunit H